MSYNSLFGLGSHSIDAALEVWWKLQETAGTSAVDSSGNSITGTVSGMGANPTTTTGPEWFSSAFDFDGSNDYVAGTSSTGTGDVTLFARFKADVLSGFQYIIGTQLSGSDGGRLIRLNGTTLEWYAIGSALRVTTATGISTGTWYSVVGVKSAATGKIHIYLNGSQASELSITGTTYSVARSNLSLAIRPDAASNYLNGALADCGNVSRAWSAAEAAEWHNGPEPINTSAPVLSGIDQENETLSCTDGTWDSQSNGAVSYSYQWTRSDDASGTGEAGISGATSSTYTLTAADVGKFIRCRVRGSNDGGFDDAEDTNSNMSGEIAAAAAGQTISLGRATESESATSLTIDNPNAIALGRVTETETANSLTVVNENIVALGRATEVESANSLTIGNPNVIELGRVTETESANSITILVSDVVVLGRAVESESVNSLTIVNPNLVSIGRATETESARGVTIRIGSGVPSGFYYYNFLAG